MTLQLTSPPFMTDKSNEKMNNIRAKEGTNLHSETLGEYSPCLAAMHRIAPAVFLTACIMALTMALISSGVSAGIKYIPDPVNTDSAGHPANHSASHSANQGGADAGKASNAQTQSDFAEWVDDAAPRPRIALADLSEKVWERSYGGERNDSFLAVTVRRSDFAIVTAGSTTSRGAGRKDAWVVAMDQDGGLLWEHTSGGALDEEATAVLSLADGDVIFAGTQATGMQGGGGAFVYRLDSRGQEVWSRHFDGPSRESFSAITELASGDLLIGGGSGRTSSLVVRITPDGDTVWEQTFDQGLPQQIRALVPAANGDIFVIGETTELFDSDGAIARVTSRGELIWSQRVGTRLNEGFSDGVVHSEGQLVLVGTKEADGGDDGWLVSVDGTGSVVWDKAAGGVGDDRLHGVTLRADQTLVAIGEKAAGEFETDNAWIVQFSSDGSISNAQTHGGENGEALIGVVSAGDGRVITVGFSQDWQSSLTDAYAITLGAAQNQVVMRGAQTTAKPPVVYVPGEGKVLTDRASVEILGNVIHSKPIKQLFVDGRPAKTRQNGAFTARVSIPLGKTRVRLEAIDSDGSVGTAAVLVTRVETGLLGSADIASIKDQIDFGNYHAVVIGNNRYEGGLPALETAERDAKAIAQRLSQNYGFDVELLLNASDDEILSSLEKMNDSLREDDNLLVYYAGHGFYDEDADLGYWLPTNASLDSKENWIRNSAVTDTIKGMKAKHVMLVADSCFSGTLLRSASVKRTGRFYEQMASRSARLVMTSGGIEPVVDGGGDGHSVFARSFLDKLDSGESIIDGTSLYQSIREPVILNSEQVPQYSNIRFIDSDGGDFLFVRQSSD
ncbi:MAG: caspase family protein [Pseudomonadota bacterium]